VEVKPEAGCKVAACYRIASYLAGGGAWSVLRFAGSYQLLTHTKCYRAKFLLFLSVSMEEMIIIPRSVYEQIKRELIELRSIIEAIKAEIALLKGGCNSRMSSIALFHDTGRSNVKSLREPGGKKSGGQGGHAGFILPLSESPDEIID
jgi:hypothetical protein